VLTDEYETSTLLVSFSTACVSIEGAVDVTEVKLDLYLKTGKKQD
jgi:hypothetical protein